MQIRHLKTIVPSADSPNRITAIAWSPNNQKLAVASSDHSIVLFDDTGDKKDKFSTKSADAKNNIKYTLLALAFSPDSSKLAVAQSDNVIYVYKLGLEWGEKKSICNKFIQSCEITSLVWPKEQHSALVFGLSDGKVKVGNTKSNKAATLYSTDHCVVSLAASMDGLAVLSGHVDGSMHKFYFDDGVSGAKQGFVGMHSCPPINLAWGECIIAAGPDRNVCMYTVEGKLIQSFAYAQNKSVADFTCIEIAPTGSCFVLGSFDRILIFAYSPTKQLWEEAPVKHIENMYTVSALAWKPDGSRLVVGNMTSAVELYDCCLRKSRYKGKFEFNYISLSQVIVKRLSTGSRIVLKSHYGYEIVKINIFQDQYLVASTPETLLLGDLATCKLSEIPWIGSGNEKFFFENPLVCMVFNAGELSFVEYGVNEILSSCRTEHMNPHLISLRLNDKGGDVKRVAFLVDLQTVHILDLTTGLNIAQISHESTLDWLELSMRGDKLLFRDKKRQLHIYDVLTQQRTTLLSFCSYVQWVPNSDVVVAQSRGNLCIWYSIDSPSRVTLFPIKGEIEDIERANGKTEVIVDEGVNTVSYTLDEGLIEFGSAIEEKEYDRAISLLETLEMTSETEAMWKSLAQTALADYKLSIAERCFAALGDVARTRYLNSINLDTEIKDEGVNSYVVRARLAVLDKQFKLAETIYLEQGKVEDAMEMYQEMHKWDQSIKVAEMRNHADLDHLKRNYFQWLTDSGQEEVAGRWKEEERDYTAAISLYLKGGMPARAAQALKRSGLNNIELTERVASSLFQSGLYEQAGVLFEQLRLNEKALDAYRRGKAFRAAIDLCRMVYPEQVVQLEEQWGDYLCTQTQMDTSISHYIEAGKMLKAVDAAIKSKQFKKAVTIIDSITPQDAAKQYFIPLAKHFSESKDYFQAEKYFIAAERTQDAVDMYIKANKWDKAHALASTYMNSDDISTYITQAKEFESKKKFREAEELYLTIDEPDLAINMYKNNKQYDNMIRLVAAYHKDLIEETHIFLGKTLESEANFKQAEHHYVDGKDWKSAINMYCANNMYEEGYRVAKSNGGPSPSKQVAYLWARSLGGESAVKLLTKLNLLDAALDFATESGAFDFAFELSRFADKYKLDEVHCKHAMFLEDEGKFKQAQDAFILAGKPREAILMHIHNQDWPLALQVAESYDPTSVADVLIGQAKVEFTNGEYSKSESLLLRAQRPEIAIKFYKESDNWTEAIRFTQQHVPNKLNEVQAEYDEYLSGKSDAGKKHILASALQFEQQQKYDRAINLYLKLSPSHTDDYNFLEEKWERAVNMALKFTPQNTVQVVTSVCKLLVDIERHESAGSLFYRIELYKDAIDVYMRGNLWDKARSVLSAAPKYKEYVETSYVNHLKLATYTDALMSSDSNSGLEAYAQTGDWEKCLDTASMNHSPDVLVKYLSKYLAVLIKERKYDVAVRTSVKYGSPFHNSLFEHYLSVTQEIFASDSVSSIISPLRDLLFNIIYGKSAQPNQKINEVFGKFLIIAQLLALRIHCSKNRELNPFCSKISFSLLRYTRFIRADLAFLEAGQFAKNAGLNNMAFVCWNRFLDLCEAIQEQDPSLLDNSDFHNTDIPIDILLSPRGVEESKREEVRDWVLQISLDQKVNQELDTRDCEQCGTSIYSASLSCYKCHHECEACCVTGYPVLKTKVKCTNCSKSANKEDWNKLVPGAK